MLLKTDEAIVLKVQKYADADLLLSFFLKEGGKRSGIAKSGARSRKRFGGILEMGSHIILVYKESPHSELLFLQEGSKDARTPDWRGSYVCITAASFALELANKSLPSHQQSKEKFEFLQDWLLHLREDGRMEQLLFFQFHWLKLLGWGMDLDTYSFSESVLRLIHQENWPLELGAVSAKEGMVLQHHLDRQWEQILSSPLKSRKLLDFTQGV